MNEVSSNESKPVAVIGSGSWGTALAMAAARNVNEVRLWARDETVASEMQRTRRNPFYLNNVRLPDNILATSSLAEALNGSRFVVLVVPSHALREVMMKMRDFLTEDMILVSATKGVENQTLMRMSEVIEDTLRDKFKPRVTVLSGPSFAREVVNGDPTAIVAASSDLSCSEEVQCALSSPAFRIYTNSDVVGVEIGGAVKNVVAIGAGVVRGLGFGSNTVAAIITRGLAEVTRLGLAMGAKAETMAGLAGLGDLVLTCTGELSRNRHVGVELGKGRKLAEILAEMREVAEGVKTTKAIYELSRKLNVDMPIIASTYALLYEGKTAQEAANELMGRPLKRE
jgi:glycerol-3-phosphate dehydrogenase (NAD(P)+)